MTQAAGPEGLRVVAGDGSAAGWKAGGISLLSILSRPCIPLSLALLSPVNPTPIGGNSRAI